MQPSSIIRETFVSLGLVIAIVSTFFVVAWLNSPSPFLLLIPLIIIVTVIAAGYLPVLADQSKRRNETEQLLVQFLDSGYRTVVPNVKRSADESRQFRIREGRYPGSTNCHLELLDLENGYVQEGYIVTFQRGYLEDDRRRGADGQRWFALVEAPLQRPTVHYYRGKPSVFTDERDERQLLPAPRFVMRLQADYQGGAAQEYVVWRLDSAGSFAGETWHQSRGEAERQLEFEYGDALSSWQPIPPEVKDAVAFMVAQGL